MSAPTDRLFPCGHPVACDPALNSRDPGATHGCGWCEAEGSRDAARKEQARLLHDFLATEAEAEGLRAQVGTLRAAASRLLALYDSTPGASDGAEADAAWAELRAATGGQP